jgi:hypothetical protein
MVVAMEDDNACGGGIGGDFSWREISHPVGGIQKGDVDVVVVISAVICNEKDC